MKFILHFEWFQEREEGGEGYYTIGFENLQELKKIIKPIEPTKQTQQERLERLIKPYLKQKLKNKRTIS